MTPFGSFELQSTNIEDNNSLLLFTVHKFGTANIRQKIYWKQRTFVPSGKVWNPNLWKFVPEKHKKSAIREIKLPGKISCHTVAETSYFYLVSRNALHDMKGRVETWPIPVLTERDLWYVLLSVLTYLPEKGFFSHLLLWLIGVMRHI